jgi:RNA polymerase sigma-32 factor
MSARARKPKGESELVPDDPSTPDVAADDAAVSEGAEHDDVSALVAEQADLAPEQITPATEPASERVTEPEILPPETPQTPDGDDPTDSLPVVHKAGEYGAVSALTRYMAELRHHAPITREEEHDLAVQWVEEGDVEAARTLVLANLRLVVKIAMEYRRAWTNTLDLVQEGNVGLMEAVQRYDPYLGVKLSSYAVYWIRAYILKYILDNMRSTRLGTTRAQRKLFFRLNKEKRLLEAEGYEVGPKLLAERLDVTEDDVIEMESRLSRPDLSMDAPARRDESDGATFGDTLAGGGTSAEADLGNAEMRRVFLEQVDDFAEALSERDKRILWARLLASEPATLADLGEEFGVSRERVRQLEARLLKQLRAHVESNVVDFEYYAGSDD